MVSFLIFTLQSPDKLFLFLVLFVKFRVLALHCGRCTSQRQTVNFKQVSFLVGDLSKCGREGWGRMTNTIIYPGGNYTSTHCHCFCLYMKKAKGIRLYVSEILSLVRFFRFTCLRDWSAFYLIFIYFVFSAFYLYIIVNLGSWTFTVFHVFSLRLPSDWWFS